MHLARLAAFAALVLAGIAVATSAQALTITECSVKYKAAQDAGTLNGMKWNDFRAAQCGAAPAIATPAAAVKPASTIAEPTLATTEKLPEPPTTNAFAPHGVTFPKAVSAQYSSQTPGKARMHTCLDEYKVNKTNNTLAGLSWIKKGGGYYSICNSKLKSL